MVDTLHLGNIIKETGDLGRFQIFILLFIEFAAFSHSWSLLFMSYGAAKPDYFCNNDLNGTMLVKNVTDQCTLADGTKCSDWTFSQDMRTVVSEVRVFGIFFTFILGEDGNQRHTDVMKLSCLDVVTAFKFLWLSVSAPGK